MAQALDGILVDYQLQGRTRFSGKASVNGHSVPWDGIVAAGGLDGRPMALRTGRMAPSILGGNFLFNSDTPTQVVLPKLQIGRHLRFLITQPPEGGNHIIRVDPDDLNTLHGGFSVAKMVPGGVWGDGVNSISFTTKCSAGDRVSLVSNHLGWYIAEGFAVNSGAVVFA